VSAVAIADQKRENNPMQSSRWQRINGLPANAMQLLILRNPFDPSGKTPLNWHHGTNFEWFSQAYRDVGADAMGALARKDVVEKFSLDSEARQIAALYGRLI